MHSQFLLATGELSGMKISNEADLANNTPPGYAWIAGNFDQQGQRVELKPDDFGNATVPVVVPFKPPAPAETEWVSWQWSDADRVWTPQPILPSIKARAAAPLAELLVSLDAELVRPTAELLESQLSGAQPDPIAHTKFMALMSRKAAIRSRMRDISLCSSQSEVEAISALPAP